MSDAPASDTRSRPRFLLSLELVAGSILTGSIVLLVLFSPLIFPDNGDTVNFLARLMPPFVDWTHPLGTDPLGKDVLARVVAGGRISLIVGVVSALGGVVIGTIMGLIAGYYRGIWDTILMRFADVQLALPFILLAITFIAIIGGGLVNMIILMIVSQWVQYARVVRGEVLSLRSREFVLAAKSFGVRDFWVLWHHILPNVTGPIIVLMTLNIAGNILLESSLTFLGLGIDPLVPSWGGMLSNGRNYLQTAWWMSLFPGLAIMITVLGLNLLGDWLRDYLDPRGQSIARK